MTLRPATPPRHWVRSVRFGACRICSHGRAIGIGRYLHDVARGYELREGALGFLIELARHLRLTRVGSISST
jgi:hypothetical protein